tara:strand:- start:38 stop:871 length:834 start_codon:yes stop_codon:yes gene_type:complete
MFGLSTSTKIYLATILSKLLIYLFRRKNFIISRNGIKYNIDLEEGIDLGIFLSIKNEKNLFKVKKYIDLDEKSLVVDIGANVGSVSLPLAKNFNNAQIYSIEPTVYAYKKLKQNINLNLNLKKRVKTFNYFVTCKKKKIKFVHSSWKLISDDQKHGIHKGILKKTSNKMISLDSLLKKNKKRVRLIKIDVDGYELEVLKSSEKTLKNEKPIIYFELAPYLYKEMGYTVDHLIRYVKKIGYAFYDEDFKPVLDIKLVSSKLTDKSQNYFLFHNSFVKI